MPYQLVDTYTDVVLGNYTKKEDAEKQVGRMYNEPDETRYVVRSTRTKKVTEETNVEKKATEDQFNELHSLVTKEFLSRIKSGEATTQDLKAACDWLKTNDISGVALEGSPLDKLAAVMPTVDPEIVQRKLYGTKL